MISFSFADKKLSLPLTKSNIKTSVDLLSPTTSDIDISESTDLAEFNSSDLSYTPKYTKTSTNHGNQMLFLKIFNPSFMISG